MVTVSPLRYCLGVAACGLALSVSAFAQAPDATVALPHAVITSVRINGSAIDITGPVDVPVGPGNLEFQYDARPSPDPSRLRFRYRLEGFDRDWAEAGSRREAFYTNLPPGLYTFHVLAGLDTGAWTPTNVALPVRLEPRFYQTATFFTVVIVAAVLGLVGGYRWRLRVLRDLQADLMRLVRERTEELEDANRRLAQMSYVDALTDVSNRRSFDEELSLEWRRSTRTRAPLSLLLIDIDGFKGFNDALGHHAGDDCLRKVAAVITECVRRAGDTVARYGGEEFVVLLPETDRAGAAVLAERIRSAVETRNIWHPGAARGRLTVSIGVATTIATEAAEPSALVRDADGVLYQAKRDGRNLVRVAGATAV